MARKSSWRQAALEILAARTAEDGTVDITQAELARLVGVARQTLWRDSELRRWMSPTKQRTKLVAGPAAAASRKQQVTELREKVAYLQQVNDRLTELFVIICGELNDRNLDAVEILGKWAPDLERHAGASILNVGGTIPPTK